MTNKIIPYEKSFASHEKAQFWSDKNEFKPNEVFKSSHEKFIFNCICGHEINITLSNINTGKWCSYCSNPPKKLCDDNNCKLCFEKSFASNKKSKFWSTKNKMQPRQIFKNSSSKYLFDCKTCNHSFMTILKSINSGCWCPYFSNKKLCDNDNCLNCFNKSFASQEKAQFWSDKNKLKARQVFKSSGEKYIFNCKICDHIFTMSLDHITSRDSWCAYCSNNKLCEEIKCKYCFEKSFSSHEKVKYWSNKNKLQPRQVFKSSGEKYIFNCECGHDFYVVLSSVSRGTWCPYCCYTPKDLCDKKTCKECYEKSFASHEKVKYWSDKNNVSARKVLLNSNNKYIFNCDCGHEFDASLGKINTGRWCPYCSKPPQKLCDDDNCKECYKKSFASHEKSKYWSDKNNLEPRHIFKSSGEKYIFICENKHSFESMPYVIKMGYWCPYCVNKTEQKLYDKLSPLYPTLQQQFKVNWCKNKTYLPFDFVIPENKIIIELDGRQHFEQVRNWDDPKKTQENDKYKMKCANDNNYSVIRILQEDVFYDTYDWLSELNDNIKDIIKNKKIQNIFMCKDNEYDIFN
jgi:very-short-patch-repair endonuclease